MGGQCRVSSMTFTIFATAAVFGLLFVGWGMLAGDGFHDADHGGEWALFSLRTLAFGSLAFGAMGLLGYYARWPSPVTVGVAALSGIGVWFGVAALFRYLRRSQSGALIADASWLGSEAELVMPFGRDGVGRISLTHGGQVIELAARRAASHETTPVASFRRCRIDDVEDNTAVVVPL